MKKNPDGIDSDAPVSDIARTTLPEEPAKAGPSEHGEIMELAINQNVFGIRVADTMEGRNSASMLISKMYAWRGYAGTHRITDDPNRITLTASGHNGEAVGTVTLGLDCPIGLLADEVFKEEVDAYRRQGARVCELTKLAFDPTVQSKEALASLFHLAVIYARDLHQCTDILIEVSPRHRRFYEHMLGFKRHGDTKTNIRVNSPSYLLGVNLQYVTEQIQKYGGTSDQPGNERSFYPYFFSVREERGIIERLRALH